MTNTRTLNIKCNEKGKRFDVSSHIILPYVKNLTDNISRTLNKKRLKVIYKIPTKLNTLIKRGKDVVPITNKTNVVYKLDCKDCNASYIGQTKRHLSTRIKEHQNNIKKQSSHSVISKHRTEFNHDFRWLEPSILHSEKNKRKREIAEMFFIKKHKNKINLQIDTDNLSPIYDKVINTA